MNQTGTVSEFLLLGFSNSRKLQIVYVVLVMLMYLAALMGNLFIITVVTLHHHLHIPMYFFLMNLSVLDIGSVSVTLPKSMANSLLNTRLISYFGCVAQLFFFAFFLGTGFFMLTVMAYDRYVAICKPLHYETIMSRRACVQAAAAAWIAGLLLSAMHTGSTFTVPFCKCNVVNQFFCEIPHLIKLSCSDSDLREFGVLALSVLLALSCFIFIMVSYVHIFTTILRLPSEQGRYKAFSTCIPHITMVSLYLINGTFAHVKPPSLSPSSLDLILAILYSVVPAMMNPIVYGLRNKDIAVALKKMIQ